MLEPCNYCYVVLSNRLIPAYRIIRSWAGDDVAWQVLAPLPIGFAVFLVHLATIPITGTGINPARSLGAAVATNRRLYWVQHVSVSSNPELFQVACCQAKLARKEITTSFFSSFDVIYFTLRCVIAIKLIRLKRVASKLTRRIFGLFAVDILGWTVSWSCMCCGIPSICSESWWSADQSPEHSAGNWLKRGWSGISQYESLSIVLVKHLGGALALLLVYSFLLIQALAVLIWLVIKNLSTVNVARTETAAGSVNLNIALLQMGWRSVADRSKRSRWSAVWWSSLLISCIDHR